jgi:predicted lipoprotein
MSPKPKLSLKKMILLVVFLVVIVFLSAQFGFTVVSLERVEDVRVAGIYDAGTFVEEMWDTRLRPTIEEQAVELSQILREFSVDEAGQTSREQLIPVVERYGRITLGEAHVYMVKGEGTVLSVNLESRVGTLELSLDGYDGATKVKLYIGPRIPGDDSSVRDAVGFIQFGDFKDQTEYGRVAAAINSRINTQVLEPLIKEELEGKRVAFYGAFAIRTFNLVQLDLQQIIVTPTHLRVISE